MYQVIWKKQPIRFSYRDVEDKKGGEMNIEEAGKILIKREKHLKDFMRWMSDRTFNSQSLEEIDKDIWDYFDKNPVPREGK
jgi:hypothetical protein